MPAAASLLLRSADLLADGHEAKARTLLAAGGALHEVGAFDDAERAYAAATLDAERAADAACVESARLERLRLRYLAGRVHDTGSVEAELHRALRALGPAGDADALSRAWQLKLNVEITACRWSAAREAAEQVIAHAHRAGRSSLEVRTMPLLAFLVQKGPLPVNQADAACRQILERVSFDRRSTGLIQLELALLSAMALDHDGARQLYAGTRGVLEELGWEVQAALVSLSSGPVELLADDPARAEAELRRDHDALERMDERNFISLTVTLLAEAVYRQQRFDEAHELVARARALSDVDDVAVQILLRSVAGKLAARAGDAEGGTALATDAVRLIEATEDPSGQGDALLDLAEVLFLTGNRRAGAAASEARERYARKGNLAGAKRAGTIASRIAAGADPLGR
jgi:tetratricopeptide (TPR) repeat protein